MPRAQEQAELLSSRTSASVPPRQVGTAAGRHCGRRSRPTRSARLSRPSAATEAARCAQGRVPRAHWVVLVLVGEAPHHPHPEHPRRAPRGKRGTHGGRPRRACGESGCTHVFKGSQCRRTREPSSPRDHVRSHDHDGTRTQGDVDFPPAGSVRHGRAGQPAWPSGLSACSCGSDLSLRGALQLDCLLREVI